MNAYLMFVLAKEQAGRERASVNGLFAADNAADTTLHRPIITILTAQDTYLANFRSLAPQAWIDSLQKVLDSETGREATRMRQIALDRMQWGNFGVEPANWFTTITRKIDLMKVEEDRIADTLLERARSLSSDSSTQFALSMAMTLAVLVVAVLFGLQVTGLLRGLRGNAEAAYRIAQGKLDEKIEVHSHNELGEIESALAEVQSNLHAMIDDASMLSQAAVEGRLATRADASRHQGDYRRIVDGVNSTLDAVIAPINEVKRVMVALSGGDLTQKITDDYAGAFRVLQNAVNDSMDKLAEIIEQVRGAADALTNAAGQVSATAQSL